MKKILFMFSILSIFVVSVLAANDPLTDFIKSLNLPAWANWLIGMVIGGGFVSGILLKVLPSFGKWLEVIKHLLRIIEMAKIKLIDDKEFVAEYNDMVGDMQSILEGKAKFSWLDKLLERLHLKAGINKEKLMKAISMSPVVKAANETIK